MADTQRDLILFVDDQRVARKYFALMFGDEYEVLTACDADEAWTLIREHGERIAVIISDQRMPNHSGADLLMAVRHKHPRIVRLLTTGYADLSEAIDAVNRGEIHAYVYKPWNIEEFGLDIRRAVELYHLRQERDSFVDMHAQTMRQTLCADRLRAYGIIAATCSGWIDRPLAATLAFWSDSNRRFIPSERHTPISNPIRATGDQIHAVMTCANRIGAWLAAHRSVGGNRIGDAASVVKATAMRFGLVLPDPQPRVELSLDPRLLYHGLHALVDFLSILAARGGCIISVAMTTAAAADGGLDVQVQTSRSGTMAADSADNAIETECLGLQAYFAIHHHGGDVRFAEWSPERAVAVVHLPPRPPVSHQDATAEFALELSRRS